MAAHVFHWRHGWIPLDHTAAAEHHGQEGSAITSRRHVALAVRTLPNVKDPVERHHAARETVTAAHRVGAKDLIPPPLAGHHAAAEITVTAEQVAAEARRSEPGLTHAMQQLAFAHRGELHGLDHAVKEPRSLAEKITKDVEETGRTPQDVAGNLFDINRYTMTTDEATHAAAAQAAINDLRQRGYQLRVKNFWNAPDNPYQGINVQVKAPDGGQFELQFNTPASLAVKGVNHKLYKQLDRVDSDAEKGEVIARMQANSEKIPIPRGIGQVS